MRPMRRGLWLLSLAAAGLALMVGVKTMRAMTEAQALSNVHAPGVVGIKQSTALPQRNGELIWYETRGKLHVAFLTNQRFGWKVEGWREVPVAAAADEVAWSVWNLDREWGLVLGTAPPLVAEIQVNGQEAVLENGIWWLYAPSPVNPPISIRALDAQRRVRWSTP